jgi:hypothetical protein
MRRVLTHKWKRVEIRKYMCKCSSLAVRPILQIPQIPKMGALIETRREPSTQLTVAKDVL